MSSSDAAKVISGGDVSVDSETTVEIKIKTLDSQTYTLRVDKCVPVPALKEQIASVTGVLSEQQRLICRGRVLKDDQLLSAYHVEDGHTLHLVVREPHQFATPSTNHMGSEGSSSASGSAHNRSSQVAQSFVFESVNVDQGDIDTSVISRIISSMLDSFGSPSTGSGNMTTDVRDMISERLGRASSDNVVSDSTQAHPNPTNPQRERGPADLRPSSAVSLAQPTVIPDSFTTLSQYIGLMRDEFSREGFNAHVNEHITNAEDTGLRSHDSHFPAAQIGLPTPASLAEVLLSTRQLVVEQTGECLSQLARQLVDHTSITDPLTRLNMQASALRSGVLMRNLGSLFLELGRTTMTLRMGQSPAEAIVNAGPANFISATGPNPLMVQAVPFSPGLSSIGTNVVPANSGHVLGGEPHDAAFLPRNIEIRIRTARAVPVIATNTSEQAPAPHQQQDQRDPSRNSSSAPANVVHQAFLGGDPAVRVPVRTVVAMPSGVNTLPSDSSTGSVRVIYPFVARVRQTVSGNASDTRATQQPTQQPLPQSTVIRENIGSNIGGAVRDDGHFPHNAVPFVTRLSASASEPAAYPGFSATVFVSSQQTPPDNNSGNGTQANDDSVRGNGTQTNDDSVRGTESHDAARVSDDQGVFLSNILRGIMPLIPQESEHGVSSANPGSSTAQVEGEDLNGSSSSQHQRGPADAPSPKRTKRNGD